MNPEILLPIIPISAIITPLIIIYYFIKFRHSERMAIIDKGLDNEQLAYFIQHPKHISNKTIYPKLAAILIGIGLAILITNIFPNELYDNLLPGFLFLFPGIGLAWVYHLEQKNISDDYVRFTKETSAAPSEENDMEADI